MKISKNLSQISEYYFSQKLKELEVLKQAGKKIINLGIGNPDTPPSKKVIEAASKTLFQKNTHGYQSYKGTLELRASMAKWYQKTYRVNVDSEKEILPLLGSKEAILQIALTYLNPADEVLIPNPGYPTYRSANLLAGATVQEYPLSPDHNWQPNWDYLSDVDYSKVKIIWCNYPNMPTGQKAKEHTFKKLIEIAIRHDILLVNDNPYSTIRYTEPQSILQESQIHPNVLELNSLSKSMNMAGWRVGMVLGHEERIRELLQTKSNIDSGMFLGVQQGAIQALEADKTWYDRLNRRYSKRQGYAQKIFEALGCAYDANQGGLFLWAKTPEGIPSEKFSDLILKEYDTFIAPGCIFGTEGASYMRLSLAQNTTKLREVLGRII